MLIQTTILGAGASVMSFCTFWGRIWLAVPIFLAMAIVAVLGWVVVLSKADALAYSRRDLLLEKLARVE
jgi:hypothetical protein